MTNRVPMTNHDLRPVSFKYLGRIRNELAKTMTAKTHEARGKALDQVTKFVERIYKEAETRKPKPQE
jgi:hypothetical protein